MGADETFFGLPVLVLLELTSGYIFIETECENRTYQTWMEQVRGWWDSGSWQCHYLVSDGARALVKLAVSGLGCVNVADLFHAMRALSRPIGRGLGTQFAALKKQQDTLQKQLDKSSDVITQPSLQSLIEGNAIAQALWQLNRTLALQRSPNPLQHLVMLEQTCTAQWQLTAEEVEQLLGVRPKCHAHKTTYQRGEWCFTGVGKLGSQTAWQVTKVNEQLDDHGP